MAKDDRDYEIGKGKPPVYTRFKKGAPSPNPKGRPRKKIAEPSDDKSASDDILREVLARQVTIRDPQGERRISMLEAIHQSQAKSALSGSPIAQRDVLRAAKELEERDTKREHASKAEAREWFAKAIKFRELRQRIWSAAEQTGGEPDEPWPHPDDILIDHGKGTWRVRGPFSESDLPFFDYCKAQRDACFAHAMFEVRRRSFCGPHNLALWELLWRSWDRELPLRWQLLPRLERAQISYLVMPLRQLRKHEQDAIADAARLRPLSGIPLHDAETYRAVNTAMKPFLTQLGYRSLAELEHEHEGKKSVQAERTARPRLTR